MSLQTAVLFPGLLFILVFILNLFVWAQASSTALPFGTLLGLAALWLFIQVPLVYAGSWYGYTRTGPWEHPTKTNVIPRQIPPQTWLVKGSQSILLAGLLPFAVIFIELLFVFKSLWQDKSGYYYVFGFLAVVSLILMLTVIEVTIVATYIQLCAEVRHSPTSFIRSCVDPCFRTTDGGGNLSSSAAPVPDGCFCTASGTSLRSSTFKALSRACYSSATASWLVSCTGS